MTSGQFTSFPVESIFVDRAKRQRKEITNVEELAASIRETGLINPPVIQRSGELIAGERRWTAVKSLGWTHIPVQFADELDELQLHLLEYEENVRRVDLPWQDNVKAVEEYHRLREAQAKERGESWTSEQTAKALGLSPGEVAQKRQVAQEIASGNARVAEAPKYSVARGITQRDRQRRASSILASAIPELGEKEEMKKARTAPLINEDFHEWAMAYCGPKFNFLHCDFPYGVGMHKSDQGAGSAFGTYDDDENVYWFLLDTLATAMSNVVADSAHLMFWFSMDFYDITMKRLTAMGWRVNPFPLIWVKDDNTGILPDAKRGPRRIYETALFASRGDRNVVGPVSNAFSAPGRGKTVHMNEKPVEMLRHFMRMFVDEYSVVLDPTCGSGNAIKAAQGLGAPTVLGIERNEEFFNLAREYYYAGDETDL